MIQYYKISRVPKIQVLNSTESFEVYGRFKYISDLDSIKMAVWDFIDYII